MKCTKENRKKFIKKLEETLKKVADGKSLDAWFFNWADNDEEDKKEAEKIVNDLLPGKWRFVHIWGNFTDFGEGWFANDYYDVYITLACFNEEGEEFIDTYEIYLKEKINYKDIETKDE